jgi:hypothetical protein
MESHSHSTPPHTHTHTPQLPLASTATMLGQLKETSLAFPGSHYDPPSPKKQCGTVSEQRARAAL